MTLVSVIIPAYNQGHYLGQALDSVLSQTYGNFEAIVVDDGSTDDTAQVVSRLDNERISYLYQENRGLSAARNTGIRVARGELITFLDSDDLFLPRKLALMVDELERCPDIGLVAGQAIPIDESGNKIGEIFDKPLPDEPHEILLGNPLHVGSVMLRRSCQVEVGFFDEQLRSYEDWDMWLRLAKGGCMMGWIPEPVSLYRFHPAQMTRDGSQMTQATFMVLDKVYSDPDIPESWLSVRDLAYSRANLRAAAQAYHAGDLDRAKSNMMEAVHLDPSLTLHNADPLANQILGWISLPKTQDPLAYLERIYNNLPPDLEVLRDRRDEDLSRTAIQIAFASYQKGDFELTRTAVRRAIRYKPAVVANRGVVSIMLRSHILAPATE